MRASTFDQNPKPMNRFATLLILTGALAFQTCDLAAQVRFGAKVGGNYVVGSIKIQPDPKDPPTNPKGVGMQFGAYLEIPF